jgi:type VI protein secretion system component VasK
MFGLIKKFVQAVLPGVIKPLHALWNELLGFLFLVLALMLVRPVWRSYQEMGGGPAQLVKFLLGAFFFATMLAFGLHAFWKARRISRS